jgi:hypothetical protein
MFPSEIDTGVSPWLLQESFNTVCATTILVVEESADVTSVAPNKQRSMIQGILDLVLHVLTTPQSSVTYLRAVGGAIQALEKFGVHMFLEITGDHLQYWIRVVLALMNSTALAVRSIAVDFIVSLLGGLFELSGNIDDVSLIIATVLPEVAAREIALHAVSGLLFTHEDAEKSLWPLRRSFADVEDANPLDDDRIDPQLAPLLAVFCRACQAIIDGVLIEMRLRGRECVVVGIKLPPHQRNSHVFDADEESLFEAANFFLPEIAPMQRLRWLLSLKSLHEYKGQWLEAGECLIASTETIACALPHINDIWRPSRFPLWCDTRKSLWLTTVGESMGNPEQGNAQVMTFAGAFLEPEWLVPSDDKTSAMTRLPQPCIRTMCNLLSSLSKDASSAFCREGGMEMLGYLRLESLLKILMRSMEAHEKAKLKKDRKTELHWKNQVEGACLRDVTASVTSDLTALSKKLHRHEQNSLPTKPSPRRRLFYVRLRLSGKKPQRFQESTTLPTFLAWDKDCICRIPNAVVDAALSCVPSNSDRLEVSVCTSFLKLIRDALLQDLDSNLLVFHVGSTIARHGNTTDSNAENVTNIEVGFVQPTDFRLGSEAVVFHEVRRFKYQLDTKGGSADPTVVEMTTATPFPCPLSRQTSVLTNEHGKSSTPSM